MLNELLVVAGCNTGGLPVIIRSALIHRDDIVGLTLFYMLLSLFFRNKNMVATGLTEAGAVCAAKTLFNPESFEIVT